MHSFVMATCKNTVSVVISKNILVRAKAFNFLISFQSLGPAHHKVARQAIVAV